jgi:hypothetical protein
MDEEEKSRKIIQWPVILRRGTNAERFGGF